MLSVKSFFHGLGAAAVLLTFSTTSAHAAQERGSQPSVIASFEGRWIRLADGWGEAKACASDGVTARCYRSESELDAAEGERSAETVLADCTLPGVRLYRGTSWGGGVLQLTVRNTLIDLAPNGFDNDTSSYRIGACSAKFYDPNSGGTPSYPGNTAAGASAASMSSGWDNRVSSVYIF